MTQLLAATFISSQLFLTGNFRSWLVNFGLKLKIITLRACRQFLETCLRFPLCMKSLNYGAWICICFMRFVVHLCPQSMLEGDPQFHILSYSPKQITILPLVANHKKKGYLRKFRNPVKNKFYRKERLFSPCVMVFRKVKQGLYMKFSLIVMIDRL